MDVATGELGPYSQQRAQTCSRIFLSGKTNKIVFTGASAPNHSISVAERMADYAVLRGVPETAILIDPDARSTFQNALFSLPMIPDAKSVIVVTDSFHLPRSWVSFYMSGYPDLRLLPSRGENGAKTLMPDFKLVARETLAIWFNLARLPVYFVASWARFPNTEQILQ